MKKITSYRSNMKVWIEEKNEIVSVGYDEFRNENGQPASEKEAREMLSEKYDIVGKLADAVIDEMYTYEWIVSDIEAAAREVIAWCDDEVCEDEQGRYWLSAYRGCGEYQLIVAERKIVGAIYGSIRENMPGNIECSMQEWVNALNAVVKTRIGADYHIIKADGSGTYFYLRNAEDMQYLDVKEYDVPDINGGLHHNIEIERKNER